MSNSCQLERVLVRWVAALKRKRKSGASLPISEPAGIVFSNVESITKGHIPHPFAFPFWMFKLFFFAVFAALVMERGITGASDWSSLQVAVVQYPLVGGLSTQDLFDKVKGYVDSASSDGARLIVLPELFALDMLDFSQPEVPQFDRIVREIYPEFIEDLRKLAIEKGIYLLAGSIPIRNVDSKRIRNRSYLFAPDGPAVYQEKMFLTPDEVEWGWEASDTLNVIQAPWGKTIITICFDSEFPLISQTIAGHVADVLLIPSMTGDAGFTRVRWAAQARAVEHMAYVLLTGTTGAPAPGWEMAAQGVVLGPSLPGFTPTLAEGEKDVADCIVHATLNMTQLREAKAARDYYPAANQQMKIIEETLSSI